MSDVSEISSETCPKPVRDYPDTVREKAKTLYLAGRSVSSIGQELPVKPDTIRKWAARYGWRPVRNAVQMQINAGLSALVPVRILSRSRQARDNLSAAIVRQSKVLAEDGCAAVKSLASDGQGEAALTKTIAETAKLVFPDWDQAHGGFTDTTDAVVIDVDCTVNNEPTPLQVVDASPAVDVVNCSVAKPLR